MDGASANVNVPDNMKGACLLESIVFGLLLEAYKEFKSLGYKASTYWLQ